MNYIMNFFTHAFIALFGVMMAFYSLRMIFICYKQYKKIKNNEKSSYEDSIIAAFSYSCAGLFFLCLYILIMMFTLTYSNITDLDAGVCIGVIITIFILILNVKIYKKDKK